MPIDYKQYPDNWKEIRARILERDKNCCQFCYVPNYAIIHRPIKNDDYWEHAPEGHLSDAMALDGVKFTKIILTIAHLDHDKENHEVSDDRLAALCQRCHLKYDMPRHVAKRKANRIEKLNNLKLDL